MSPNVIKKRERGLVFGVILVVLGFIFLLNNYGLTNLNIGKLWPLFIILLGVTVLLGRSKER